MRLRGGEHSRLHISNCFEGDEKKGGCIHLLMCLKVHECLARLEDGPGKKGDSNKYSPFCAGVRYNETTCFTTEFLWSISFRALSGGFKSFMNGRTQTECNPFSIYFIGMRMYGCEGLCQSLRESYKRNLTNCMTNKWGWAPTWKKFCW